MSPISRGVLALLGIKPGVPAGAASHLAPSATPVTDHSTENVAARGSVRDPLTLHLTQAPSVTLRASQPQPSIRVTQEVF